MTTSEMPTGGAGARPHRLVRTPDKKIAGVASGIGHYLGIDPTIVRIAFIVLAFAGGIGILLYLACWLVMPKGEIAAAEPGAAGGGGRAVDPWTLGALVALVLGVGLLFGWHGLDGGFEVVAGLALIGAGVWMLVRERPPGDAGPPGPGLPDSGKPVTPPPAPPAPEPARWEARSVPASDVAGAAGTVEGAAPAAPEARRGLITAGVLSLISIGAALVIAGTLSGWFDATASVVLAATLCVVGAGLVLASVVGRAPWLFVIGVLLTCALLASAAIEPLVEDGIGEKVVAPAALSELDTRYAYGIGDYTVDLRDVALAGAPRRVEIELGAGALTVLLPERGRVVVDGHVQAGQLSFPAGRTADGWDESLTYADGSARDGALVIDMELGFGEAEVRRG